MSFAPMSQAAQSSLIAALRNHIAELELNHREIDIAVEQCAQVAIQYHATPIADAIRRRFVPTPRTP